MVLAGAPCLESVENEAGASAAVEVPIGKGATGMSRREDVDGL